MEKKGPAGRGGRAPVSGWRGAAGRAAAFFRRETILCVSGILALASCFAVPPNAGYLGYINFSTLITLFCLMSVVGGMRRIGAFDVLSRALVRRVHGTRGICLVLTLLCFGMSMFLTNDVTLLTIVPFTLLVLESSGQEGQTAARFLLVMETVAANLGSMLTPFGNPQNLYLYQIYGYSMGAFLALMLPYTLISLGLILAVLLLHRYDGGDVLPAERAADQACAVTDRKRFLLYCGLFVLSVMSVARIVDDRVAFLVVLACILAADRKVLVTVDYSLLLTFVFFFIFIGNMGNIAAVRDLLERTLTGREVLISILASQVISNVPAAILLSGFTDNGAGLIIGTDLGGLGTLIASMASLITYRFFAEKYPEKKGAYLAEFTLVNVIFLVILYLGYLAIG